MTAAHANPNAAPNAPGASASPSPAAPDSPAARAAPSNADAPLPQHIRDGVFVVIAAYNETQTLPAVVAELRHLYDNVVVVDDGSHDATFHAARRCARYVLRHAVNRGQGAALQTGIDFALLHDARYVVTFDADGQHRPEDIAALLQPILAGRAEIALGSRFLSGAPESIPLSRRLVLKLAVLFTRLVNGVKLTDAHNGLRCFSRSAAERIHISADRMAHASEIIDLIRDTGLPYTEVPVTIRYTDYSLAKGQSSLAALRIMIHYIVGRLFD